MKTPILLLVLTIVLCACSRYEAKSTKEEKESIEIPTKVQETFTKQFPEKSNVEWEMENEMYEGTFLNNGLETSVVIDANGAIIETETVLNVDLLPEMALNYIQSELYNGKIAEAAKIVKADGSIFYEAEVNGEDYLFDSNGNFTEKEIEIDDAE